MEIEVGQANGIFLKAKVQEVTKDGIKVEYLNSWSQPEVVKFSNCRIPSKNPLKNPSNQFKVGGVVEAYIKQPESEVHGWQKAKIREIKGSFVVLACIEGPSNSEIVSLEQCRPFGQTTPLSFELFNKFSIDVPSDLVDFFDNAGAFDPLHEHIEGINVDYLKSDRKIIVTSFSPHAIRCVEVLSDSFLHNSKQKKIFTEQLRDSKSHAGLHDGKFVEQFSVPDDLVGLAIGKKGANISDARQIEGVLDIIVDKSRQEKAGVCMFKVIAETAQAASEARKIMEYIYASVSVPKDLVGQVVGKLGKNMQEIVNQSGAVKVQIGQAGDEEKESQTGEVDFIFTGTRESFKLAKLMIQFQLKHILEMDALRTEIDELAKDISDAIPPNFRSTGRRQLVPKNFDKK